jgi:hypothetical protein
MKEYQKSRTNFEEHNLMEIEGLNQRGKTLSIVDLIRANTLSLDMAAYSMYAIANGASFLTAARPGNAGKTTLLACLLTLLPPGIKIISVNSPNIVTDAHKIMDGEEPSKFCFTPHEISGGRIYGYLWGKHVGQLIHLTKDGCRVASCIHADMLSEMHNIMVSGELDVSEEDFNRLGLIMFIKIERELTGYRRRVLNFYESYGDRHNLVFTWDSNTDTFKQRDIDYKSLAQKYGKPEEQVVEDLKRCRSFIESLMNSGKTDFTWVRQQVFNFYSGEIK